MSNPPTPGSELGRVGTSDQGRAGLKPQRRPYTNHLSLVTRETGEGVVVEHRTVVPQKTPNAEHPAKSVGVRAASQAWILAGERSSLRRHIAAK